MKMQHIFCRLLHIMGKYAKRGGVRMEQKQQYEDVDDFIFAQQEWYPSEK